MKWPYDLIIIDLELDNPNSNNTEIIEIGAIKLLRNGVISLDMFSELITPTNPISKDIQKLTGITNEEMKEKGISFSDAMQKLETWATKDTKNIVFAGWGGDIPYLKQYGEKLGINWPFRGKNLDIKSIAVFMSLLMKNHKSDGLGGMMASYGLEFDDQFGQRHRALPDAFNTALLLSHIISRYENTLVDIDASLRFLGNR